MLKVLLIRHGETDWNKDYRVQGGNSDIPLNTSGREQADRLAQRLRGERVLAVYSSPLKRARDTAQIIARYHRLPVQVEAELRELNVGELEGVSVDEVARRLDELISLQGEDNAGAGAGESLWSKVHRIGGESLEELQQRAWGVVQRIIGQQQDGVIVVVSHYFAIITVICASLKLPLSQIGRLRFGVASISAVVFDGQVPRLILFNDTCHLD